jgi:hypothetical protein
MCPTGIEITLKQAGDRHRRGAPNLTKVRKTEMDIVLGATVESAIRTAVEIEIAGSNANHNASVNAGDRFRPFVLKENHRGESDLLPRAPALLLFLAPLLQIMAVFFLFSNDHIRLPL